MEKTIRANASCRAQSARLRLLRRRPARVQVAKQIAKISGSNDERKGSDFHGLLPCRVSAFPKQKMLFAL